MRTESEVNEMNKRTIEVFTAGCPICNDTLELVRKAVSSCGCEVVERRCSGEDCCEPAKKYGVRAMPTVVVDGNILFEGGITQAQAALLKRVNQQA
jgi:hypothetical protein